MSTDLSLLFCRTCDKDCKTTEVKGDFGPHHSKITCGSCNTYLRWGAKPANTSENERLDKFFASIDTSENRFFKSLQDQWVAKRRLTPGQLACIYKHKSY
jgi:hypothetical protein